ncbi:acyltransferase [Leptospira barantonii]|uniref:Acyltransferase n=1 Tax=Leptospira barantonii TaxID=2023184 RepID=A0A5F2BUH0_9LEPT|nr:acyltransferase [Leptospira barantonii]TGM09728.1 acyltransferase [Leptospira barantonii]
MTRQIFSYLFSPFLKNEKEIQALNGIRAIAILLVIVYHVWLPFGVADFPQILKNTISNFNSGVDLFFVLSGFLIYSGILKYSGNPERFKKGKFFLARSLRIFPAYYVCLMILYLYFQGQFDRLSLIENPNEFQLAELKSVSEVLRSSYADFLYISNYTKQRLSLVGWSLSIEEQFYLILPFFATWFLFRLNANWRISILSVLYTIPLIFRIFYVINDSDLSVLIYSHTRMDSLVIGMILAEIKVLSSRRDSFLLFLGIAALTIGHVFPLEHWFRKTLGYNFFNIGYVILIYLSLNEQGRIARVLSSAIFRPIARLSYTMYLWNILIAGVAVSKVFSGVSQPHAGHFVLAILTAIVYCFLFSWLLYLIVEKPFLVLKERILSSEKSTHD